MQFEEKTINKHYIFEGKILTVRKDEVLLPNGDSASREFIEHNGGSSIYCEKDNKVVLVKQFRYPYKQEIWELPAGKLNKGEDPEDTARRELEEECGIKANKIEKLFDMYPSPGYTNEVIRIYKASELEETKQNLDDGEFLTCKWFTKEELKEMISSNKINDAKTLIALLKML
jgi:ADP-ribose pyrophosphatase